jgi:flagellar basal-body rod protein FlgF
VPITRRGTAVASVGRQPRLGGQGGRPEPDESTVPYGLYLSAEGAHAQTVRMETLANNLANIDTVAFKRDQALFQARLAEAMEQGIDDPGSGSINDLGGGVAVLGTVTDYSQAALKMTKAATDFAINGGGFFVVQRGNQQLLTRAGNFQVDIAGQLINADGLPVISDLNAPIVLDPEAPWMATPDGGFAQNGDVYNMAMVRPRSLGDLVKVGDNLYRPLAPPIPIEPENRQVKQGFLESSNVSPTGEMVELIETSRAIEANIAMIRNQDELLNDLISQVLKET